MMIFFKINEKFGSFSSEKGWNDMPGEYRKMAVLFSVPFLCAKTFARERDRKSSYSAVIVEDARLLFYLCTVD